MSEEKRPEAEVADGPASKPVEEPKAAESAPVAAAPQEAPLPAAEAKEAVVTQEPARHPVAEAAAAPNAVEEKPATVAEPVPAAAPARPRRQFQPKPDTGKKIGPLSASMWILVFGVIAFLFALLGLLF